MFDTYEVEKVSLGRVGGGQNFRAFRFRSLEQ